MMIAHMIQYHTHNTHECEASLDEWAVDTGAGDETDD